METKSCLFNSQHIYASEKLLAEVINSYNRFYHALNTQHLEQLLSDIHAQHQQLNQLIPADFRKHQSEMIQVSRDLNQQEYPPILREKIKTHLQLIHNTIYESLKPLELSNELKTFASISKQYSTRLNKYKELLVTALQTDQASAKEIHRPEIMSLLQKLEAPSENHSIFGHLLMIIVKHITDFSHSHDHSLQHLSHHLGLHHQVFMNTLQLSKSIESKLSTLTPYSNDLSISVRNLEDTHSNAAYQPRHAKDYEWKLSNLSLDVHYTPSFFEKKDQHVFNFCIMCITLIIMFKNEPLDACKHIVGITVLGMMIHLCVKKIFVHEQLTEEQYFKVSH